MKIYLPYQYQSVLILLHPDGICNTDYTCLKWGNINFGKDLVNMIS